jgi:hypothetical protein
MSNKAITFNPSWVKFEIRISKSETNPKLEFQNPKPVELPEKVIPSAIPAKAGIQNDQKILDSGSRFACPE